MNTTRDPSVCSLGHPRRQRPNGSWICSTCARRRYALTYASVAAVPNILANEGDGYWFDETRFGVPSWVVASALSAGSRDLASSRRTQRTWRRQGFEEPRFNEELFFDQ